MRRIIRSAMLVALAISAGLVASSNASAAMVKTVVETVSNIQNTFTIMAAAPAQPAAPTAVAGNKSATITWTAPTNNGSAITSYTVTSIPGEFTCTVSSLSCVITGLSNETSYTFTVTATNSLGTSVQSNQSAAVTPTHTPRQLSSATAATNYSTFVAYTPDGRYGLIATDSAPPSIVKFDFATGTVTETIDLASNTPVVNEVAYDENYAYFFYSGGFAKLDMAGMFVVTTPSFGTASSKVAVDNTGAYLLRTLNPNVNDAKSYLKKYDSTTGAEVASVTVGTSSSTEIADVFVVDDTAYLLVQTSSKLTLRKVQISTMALNASAIDIDPGKNGTNFFIRDVKVLADSNTAVVTYRSDDQFSSLSGNKIHIAKLGLNPMSLQGLVTTDNGADTAISYNAVAYDELGYGYWFTNSTLSANGNMNKVSIDNLSVVIKSAFATKPTTEANREFIRVAQVYDGKLTVIGESSTVGWMRTFAVGDVANEPTNLTAQYGDQQATLTWRSPTDLGVGTDVSYTVESTVGGFNCTTIELRCVVTGLTNGTSYIFKVTATNTDGVGLASATTSVTPKRAPDAPTAATATYGAASATVSWSAPANNGGATISSYTVTSNPGGKTCTTATRTCAVTGLTNGTSYTFSVTATNVAGTSPASPETTAVIPRTVPSAPNSVTTAFGNTEVSLTWSAPTIDGGASISGYRVVSNPGSKTCTTDALTTACTITGLTNGTAYTFAVTAQNSEGSSSAATSASVTPATKPDAPAAPKVISTSNGAVGLSVSAPVNNGGAAISSYRVTSNPGGKFCTASTLTNNACTVSGLTNGTTYTFTATAKNIAGTSEDSPASTNAIPRTSPSAPTGLTATFGNASVSLSWSAPVDNGGFAISSYKVTTVGNATKTCTVNAPTTTCVITGLTNGTTYSFSVIATNGASLMSAASISASATPKTTPSAPLAPSIVAGDGQLTLSWTPQGDGGSRILSYRIFEVDDPALNCTVIAPTTKCTLLDLVNGASYSFKVVATNELGDSAESAMTTSTPYGLPDAPVIYETQPLNNSVVVRWSAPVFDGGSPVLEYTVTASPSGKTCTSVLEECEVTGLANGTAYSFTVKAKNLRGFGSASDAFVSEPAWGVPSAPTAVQAAPGEWEALVSWQAPNNTNPERTTYTVVSEPPGFGCTITELTSCVVSELTNGTSYKFSVTATNESNLQVSPASSWSNSVLPVEAPSEPQNVRVRSHTLGLLVSWDAPAFDGGSAVTSYTVRDEEWLFECVTTKTYCVVEGLELGANYSFTVRAENAAAQSMPTDPTAGVSYQLVEQENLGVTAGVVSGDISVAWSKPQAFANTSGITYLAIAEPSGKTCEVAEPTRTCRISGLGQGVSYTVSVLASDQSGISVMSSVNPSVLVFSKPAAPQAPTVSAGSSSVTVSWSMPSDGGSPILSYKVVEVANPAVNCVVLAPALTCSINGLTNGLPYAFKVLATNIAGDSELSAASAEILPIATPDAPTLNELVSGNTQVRVSWFAPELDGGSPILGYTVTSTPGAKTCTTTALECTVTGLTNGTKYTFTVTARNKVGTSAASEVSRVVTPWSAPSAPTGIKAVADAGAALVSWIAPSNTDADSTSYTATSTPGGFECAVTGSTSCVVEGLENGVAYTFTVIAINDAGASKASAASASVTPRTVPNAPQQVIPRVVSTGIEVTWIAPDFDGGSKVTFYTATAEPSGKTCVTSKTSCVITGLIQGEDYYVSVTASNVAGESSAKEFEELVTFGAVPGKPTSVFAISGPGEMTVSWAAPSNTGGSDIEYYVAESTPGGFVCVVDGRSCVVTGLTNGTKYTFTVRAANKFGESDNSIASAALAPVAKPGQPSVVESVFISYDKLLVNWTSASANVNAYQVSLLEPNYPYAEISTTTVSGATLSYTFEGLDPDEAYRVQVIAYGGGANYIRAAAAPARKVGPVLFTEYPMVTGAASVGKTLQASDGVFVGLPAPSLTRAWYRCNVAQLEQSPLTKDCVAIKGATGGSYKLTSADIDKFIAFGVTATNAYGDTVAYGVVPGKVVSAPILSRPSTFSGTAKSGRTLTSSLGTWVGTAKITYKYQWMRCTTTYKAATSKGAKCSAISGATKATYKLAAGDVGRFVRLVVTATNAYGKAESHSVTTGKVSK